MTSTSGSLHKDIESGDPQAQLAYDVYIHRLRKYIGAYMAVLGDTDVIVFTAGVGENDAAVRRDALAGLTGLGVELDEHRNGSGEKVARRISSDDSRTTVLVVPTDEELAIACACATLISNHGFLTTFFGLAAARQAQCDEYVGDR